MCANCKSDADDVVGGGHGEKTISLVFCPVCLRMRKFDANLPNGTYVCYADKWLEWYQKGNKWPGH